MRALLHVAAHPGTLVLNPNFQTGKQRLYREQKRVGRQQARRRLVEQHAGRGGEEGVRRVGQGEEEERERLSVGGGPGEEQEPIEISLSAEAEEEPERFSGEK